MSEPSPKTHPSTTDPDVSPTESPSASTEIGPDTDNVIEVKPDPLVDPDQS